MARRRRSPESETASVLRGRLLDAAGRDGVDLDIVRDTLWMLAVHWSLVALPTAAQTVLEILRLAPASWNTVLEESGLADLQPALNWVIARRSGLAREIGPHFDRRAKQTGRNPVVHVASTECQAYALLCEPWPDGDERLFALLVGQVLLAHISALQTHSAREDYETCEGIWRPLPDRIDPHSRAVRRLSMHEHQHHLRDLPVEDEPTAFPAGLRQCRATAPAMILEERQQLGRYLGKLWGKIPWRHRGPVHREGGTTSGGGPAVGRRVVVEEPGTPGLLTWFVGEEGDPGLPAAKIILSARPAGTRRSRRARLESDLPPDEIDDDEVTVLVSMDCAEGKRDLGALASLARARDRHIAAANQMLPWAYEGLAIEEVARLMGAVSGELRELPGRDDLSEADKRAQTEVLLLVHVMLWTGSDVDRAAGLRLELAASEPGGYGLSLIVPGGQDDAPRWRMLARAPDYATDEPEDTNYVRDRDDFLELPDLVGITPVILRHAAAPTLATLHGRRVFETSPESLRTGLQRWLKRVAPDGRTTATKISQTLFSRVLRHCGDSAMATALTCREHPIARVREFYTTLSVAVLRQKYEEIVRPLALAIYQVVGKKPRIGGIPLPPAEGAVGARLCLRSDAVRHFVRTLRKDIDQAARYDDLAGFWRYHNLLTLFTLQYFAYASSIRAVGTPYHRVSDIHPRLNVLSLSDKDDETHHKTRLVWIPDALIRQMTRYEQHLRTVGVQVRLERWVGREPCFLFGANGRAELARPATIEPLLRAYLPIRANSHRRFLRTELLERGCPPEIIDAFLGHWQIGEDPFSLWSSFNFADYVVTLRGYLEPLLADIGFGSPVPCRLSS